MKYVYCITKLTRKSYSKQRIFLTKIKLDTQWQDLKNPVKREGTRSTR